MFVFMISCFCPGSLTDTEIKQIHTVWSTVSLGKVLDLELVLEAEQSVFFIMPHWIFTFKSIITKSSPQTTAKTSHASYTHFSPFKLALKCPPSSLPTVGLV